jgi:hypothetical protein
MKEREVGGEHNSGKFNYGKPEGNRLRRILEN